jgi:hypothetical protein
MAVFLTHNSPGLRTSPVKRGYWIARRLLGEKIPPPPPNVPELPNSEASAGELSLRELLARHRKHPSCSGCHDRFDGLGLLLEGFDPIGKPRTHDLGGRVISAQATLPGDFQAQGLAGLQEYLNKHRRTDFLDSLCRSLLSYALGRTLSVSDDLLLERMRDSVLKQSPESIGLAGLLEVIVESPQFLYKRGSEAQAWETQRVHTNP